MLRENCPETNNKNENLKMKSHETGRKHFVIEHVPGSFLKDPAVFKLGNLRAANYCAPYHKLMAFIQCTRIGKNVALLQTNVVSVLPGP